jgi:hypothetical protein
MGEFINRFRRGSLSMQMPEGGTQPLKTTLYGTVNGVVGVIASLPQDQFAILQKVRQKLRGSEGGREWSANDRTMHRVNSSLDRSRGWWA